MRRRSFLKFAGATLLATTASGILARRTFAQAAGGVNLGSGDTAVLNYAFALEQLEAEFYILVAKVLTRAQVMAIVSPFIHQAAA